MTSISLVPVVRPAARAKPLVVFDMAFNSPVLDYPPPAISGAAQALASVLGQHGLANMRFLDQPLIDGGINRPSFFETDPHGPKIFMITLYDEYIERTQQEISLIREHFPGAFILLGGPAANVEYNLKGLASFFPEATLVYRGEGEKDIAQIVQILSQEEVAEPFSDHAVAAFMQMQGLYVKHQGFEYQDERANILTPDEFSRLRLDFSYPHADIGPKRIELGMHTSRGCRYRCSFCSHQYRGKNIVGWSADHLLDDLYEIHRRFPAEADADVGRSRFLINYSDDTFFYDRQRVLDFIEGISRDSILFNRFSFLFMGSVNDFYLEGRLDEKLLDSLTRVWMDQVTLGTDGFHPKTLSILRKGYRWEKAEALISALN